MHLNWYKLNLTANGSHGYFLFLKFLLCICSYFEKSPNVLFLVLEQQFHVGKKKGSLSNILPKCNEKAVTVLTLNTKSVGPQSYSKVLVSACLYFDFCLKFFVFSMR